MSKKVYIDSNGCKVWVAKKFITDEEEQELLDEWLENDNLIQHEIKVFGRLGKQHRLSASLGHEYAYSGTVHPKSK